jgi:hypothetical protein
MKVPASAFDDFLSQPISVARRFRRMIRRAIALDTQKIRTIAISATNPNVDVVSSYSDLKDRFESC